MSNQRRNRRCAVRSLRCVNATTANVPPPLIAEKSLEKFLDPQQDDNFLVGHDIIQLTLRTFCCNIRFRRVLNPLVRQLALRKANSELGTKMFRQYASPRDATKTLYPVAVLCCLTLPLRGNGHGEN
uniref:Uncharacterized protein n=1 Tax=Cryptomonas curvata TaxID=233186 RepID=A0A7S0MCP2_9CRYP|mmetsp:Transcript_3378/g.7439  ORF Transcript_3378/g.7439 Transcript_3378/m.7439 type:complete len:127 (+) Transcript_3378:233-613(+)